MKDPFSHYRLHYCFFKKEQRLMLFFLLSILYLFSCSQPSQTTISEIPDGPNIVIIVADDMGYSDLGCFGSEISTPNIDALASFGQIFSNFHTSAACSPTRAMLLSGVDHHLAGMGIMGEFTRETSNLTGKPGYEGHLNNRVVSIASLLKDKGYHTYISGKWHLGRSPEQSPTAKGFDKSYVLLDGTANNYYPDTRFRYFWSNGEFVNYPAGKFSTQVYTDKLIEFIEEDASEKRPFFMLASYTAPHWPLQAPEEYLDKYDGQYDAGYNRLRIERLKALKEKGIIPAGTILDSLPKLKGDLTRSPTGALLPWDKLGEKEKKLSARSMELYAAMLENLDTNIGRLISHLKSTGQYENTLFVFFSDNGASPREGIYAPEGYDLYENMGKPHSYVAYGPGWAHASSVANRLYKGYSTQGGIHTPMIVKLPGQKIKKGVLSAFSSVLDLVPTILEITGTEYPEEYQNRKIYPLQGKSMIPYLHEKTEFIHEKEYGIGWELFGRMAFRKGNWKITQVEEPLGAGRFELFDLNSDPAESKDLSLKYPEKLAELKAGWEEYVKKNGVVIPIWKK